MLFDVAKSESNRYLKQDGQKQLSIITNSIQIMIIIVLLKSERNKQISYFQENGTKNFFVFIATFDATQWEFWLLSREKKTIIIIILGINWTFFFSTFINKQWLFEKELLRYKSWSKKKENNNEKK